MAGYKDSTVWQITHIVCILTHLAMVITAFAIFAINGINGKNGDYAAYPWASFGIAMLGIASNGAVYIALRKVSKHIATAESFSQNVRFVLAILVNALVAIADMSIGGVMISKIDKASNLAAVLAFAFVAGIAALATLGVDYVAFRDIRKMRDKERRENEERENHSLTIVN